MNTKQPDVIIPEHIVLENARKNIIYDSEEPFLGQRAKFSEWAVIRAFSNYKVGERVPWAEFSKTLIEAQTEQELNHLIELGLIDAIWDEKQEAIVFKARQ